MILRQYMKKIIILSISMYENVYAVQNISVVPSINNGVGGF